MSHLDLMVADWLVRHKRNLHVELNYYRGMTLDDVIYFSCRGRGIHGVKLSHQKRLNLESLDLFAMNVLTKRLPLQKAITFDNVFSVLDPIGKNISDIGPLAVYDAALRIGWFLRLLPDQVFIQTGSLKGASNLEKKGLLIIPCGARSLPKASFPKPLQTLEPFEIENFLCVNKELLRTCVL